MSNVRPYDELKEATEQNTIALNLNTEELVKQTTAINEMYPEVIKSADTILSALSSGQLRAAVVLPDGTNLNTIKITGRYKCEGTNTYTNSPYPNGTTFYFDVISDVLDPTLSTGSGCRTANSLDGTNSYTNSFNTNTNTSWVEILSENDISDDAEIGKAFKFVDDGTGKPALSNTVQSIIFPVTVGIVPEGLLNQIPFPFTGSFGGSDGKRPINQLTGLADEEWALCDGTNGTPNLVDKFIYGGDGTTQGTEGGDVVTEGHTLTVAQLAGHTHNTYITDNDHWQGALVLAGGATSTTSKTTVLSTGGSQPHTHNQNLPPHIVLAYIMKLPQA